MTQSDRSTAPHQQIKDSNINISSPPPTKRQQILGIVLVVSVSIIWVTSAEFIQFIFGDSDYDKPYFLSYICVSMFSCFLLGFLKKSWRQFYCNSSHDFAPVPSSPQENRSSHQASAVSLTFSHVFRLAAILTPFFLVCNWTFNLGLAFTSVASSSIIATLTSLFTLAIGALSGVEKFSIVKLVASIISVGGVTLIILIDNESKSTPAPASRNPLLGDFVSIISAVLYATYTIILKARAGPEGAISMAMLLGILGALTALFAWPAIFVFHWTGIEVFEWPSGKVAVLLLVNALIGTVLSDFLWALSIVLTTPVTTTLSLSLTVPLSIIFDAIWHQKRFNIMYFIGALLVLIGFIMVNLDVASSRRSIPEDDASVEEEIEMPPIVAG